MSNRVSWFDMPVVELERACEFYAAVLDCDIHRDQATSGEIGVISHADGEIAGALFCKAGYPPSAEGALVYLNVSGRLHDAVAAVRVHGGEVLRDVHAISPWGYRALVLDSEGNRVALHSYY
jgi:predicted enzyme related to lactoylglutathione lyase